MSAIIPKARTETYQNDLGISIMLSNNKMNTFDVIRNNKKITVVTPYQDIEELQQKLDTKKESYKGELKEGYLYLNSRYMTKENIFEILENNKNVPAIIFDFRSYSKGYLTKTANFLFPEKRRVEYLNYADLSYCGLRRWISDCDNCFVG
jgi:hypothetical protein